MLHSGIYYSIGLMSGSSLDGLDICYVEFSVKHSPSATEHFKSLHAGDWKVDYNILQADCIEYDNNFREKLQKAANLSAFEFAKLHTELGKQFGILTKEFIQKNNIERVDFIASHGQTVFHQPEIGFTTQIGCGAQIAAQSNCKVVCDLRSGDVAYGGHGAPIVPAAELYLFSFCKIFINIGGIANISFHENENKSEHIIAYDICAANTVLNYLARQKGMDYDKDGKLARSGAIIPDLFIKLNEIAFCRQAAPKSIGSEHIYAEWIPLFDKYDDSIEDKLCTMVEHIAVQLGKSIKNHNSNPESSILISGGGALNSYLIERIQQHSHLHVVIPDLLTIQHKEALAMAFIGLLRVFEMPNCISTVTGAKKNATGGAIYLP